MNVLLPSSVWRATCYEDNLDSWLVVCNFLSIFVSAKTQQAY